MTDLPAVLIIGDSISMGYTPRVVGLLAGAARVVRHDGNGGDSANVAARLDEWLAGLAPAVVHFNCGLHDIRVLKATGAHQVPLPAYRENLKSIVRRLSRTGARLIWAATTPVNEAAHNTPQRAWKRLNADVASYNAAAAEVVSAGGAEPVSGPRPRSTESAGAAINDLHALVAADPAAFLAADGVHMTDEGYRQLAQAVAEAIRAAL